MKTIRQKRSAKRSRPAARRQVTKTAPIPALKKLHPEASLNVVDFPELPGLVNYVRQGRCALFVGAGLSAGAGLPDWRHLMLGLICSAAPFAASPSAVAKLERSIKKYGAKNPSRKKICGLFRRALAPQNFDQLFAPPEGKTGTMSLNSIYAYHAALERMKRDMETFTELSKLLEAGKFPELAGYCRDLLGRRAFHELVRSELRSKGEIPATHQSIVRTPYACIVTTNFDNLLEDAFARWDPQRGIPKVPTGAELAQQGTLLLDGAFFILKAHGDLDDESSIIFTSEDYRRVIHSNPAFQAMLTGILLSHAVLFVGYSLSDTNFRLLLDSQLTIFNEHVPPRYALMEGVGAAEREILWRTAKLRVFSYEKGKHEVVGRFLGTLAERTGQVPAASAAAAVGESSGKPVTPRRPLGRVEQQHQVILAIFANGDRITLDLRDEIPGSTPRRIWSGGCQWPDWPELKASLGAICSSGTSKLADANSIGAQLQRVLPEDLVRCLEEVPFETVFALALSPETETIPWEWLIVNGSPLCLRNPVVRRPVGISDKARGFRSVGIPLRALIVGDAGTGDEGRQGVGAELPGAAREARAIAKLVEANNEGNYVKCLERENAGYAQLVAEVETGDYDIIHFAGHAWFEQSQSLLYLWDGRVSSSELASLLNRRPPALLVLNTHYTAFVPPGVASGSDHPEQQPESAPGVDRPPPAALGFTAPASRSGVGAFVGGFGAMSDNTAAEFAIKLYQQLLGGASFARALHEARKATTSFDDITGLCYCGTGYPDLLLCRGRGVA